MSNHSELIEQFKSITNADDQTTNFFLESHNWDIEQATLSFFESGGSTPARPTATAPSTSARPTSRSLLDQMDDEDEDDQPYRRPPQQSSSSSSSSKPKSKPSSGGSRGGIRTLSDFSRDDGSDHDDDDDDDDKSQNYFTGGEKSGLMVQSAPKQKKSSGGKDDVVDDVFDSAKKQGAKPAGTEKEQKEYFDGTGYQLGSGGSSEVQKVKAPKQKEEVEEVKITFWANGFTLNDGPLRRLDDPANRNFLEHIQQGKVPPELARNAPAGGLSIHLIDSRTKDYTEPPKPKYVAFSGSGNTLGSGSPTTTTTTTSSSSTSTTSTSSSSNKPTINVDKSQPTTTIQIVLADGTRQNATFNESHTLQDLISYINQLTGNSRPFDLLSGFPQKPMAIDPSKSLKDADLLNSSVKQKYK